LKGLNVYPAHLHYEIWKNDHIMNPIQDIKNNMVSLVDPQKYLEREEQETQLEIFESDLLPINLIDELAENVAVDFNNFSADINNLINTEYVSYTVNTNKEYSLVLRRTPISDEEDFVKGMKFIKKGSMVTGTGRTQVLDNIVLEEVVYRNYTGWVNNKYLN